MKNIVLIGLMGCGKTTLGALLSERLKLPFLDLDAYIEQHYGSIDFLFSKGQDHFREIEAEAVRAVSSLSAHILSTGGGVVLREENVKQLRGNGILFFLDRPVSQIIETIDSSGRPLLKDGTDILYTLYEKRLPFYLSACHYHIDASGDLEDTYSAIAEIVKNLGLSN